MGGGLVASGEGQPLVFNRPWRPWWRPALGFAVFLVIVLLATERKGTLEWPADVLIAAGFVAALSAFVWGAHRLGSDLKLVFDGWLIGVCGKVVRDRIFDARDIVRMRYRRVRAGGRSFGVYSVRLRGRERRWQEFRIPVTVFEDPRVFDEILSRVAAAPDVDADPETAELLEAWRRAGSGPHPPARAPDPARRGL